VTPRLHIWPAPSQALALVASPRLKLQHLSFLTASNPARGDYGHDETNNLRNGKDASANKNGDTRP